jgi:choline dehydrogenase-like flavoprotein
MKDIIADGLDRGWQVINAATLLDKTVLETDVVIIGSGAGGATSAEFLSRQGLNVLIIEEAKLRHQKDFKLNELEAFSSLYQEGTGRKTADGAIAIYQGRSVGGSTTVNWTSTFRTPEPTLQHWQNHFGLSEFSQEKMQPWFEEREHALNMEHWLEAPNENNAILKRGCDALGWQSHTMIRNVKGCLNLGYCGFGCPTNAKQSMLVTSIPKALDHQASLLTCASADHFTFKADKISELICKIYDAEGFQLSQKTLSIRARHFVLSAGAIGSPAVLLRSKAPDPYQTLGKRTFLHPVNTCTATMNQAVRGFEGAPQSIYSDEFLWKEGVTGPVGFKLEVAPVFPGGLAAQEALHGSRLSERLRNIAYTNSTIALLRDGFHEQSQGGSVKLRADNSPVLDYPITDYLKTGFIKAYLAMAELQFAAGAKSLSAAHHDAQEWSSWQQAKAEIPKLSMEPLRAALFSAHVMGGCAMGTSPETSVVNQFGEHHQIRNLNIIDGSCFPTSIGANPQLSIYALAAKLATHLATRLKFG